jgi:hypothetical protein
MELHQKIFVKRSPMMKTPRFFTLVGMIIFAALARLLPHPWNFTPVAAMALFGGAQFESKAMGFVVPFGALFLSDILLGPHPTFFFVYGAFALTVLIGFSLRGKPSVSGIALAALSSSLSFFLITNFGHWMVSFDYPKTFSGLMVCYSAAIPFFRNTLAGDFFYTAILFGLMTMAERRFPALQPAAAR